MVSPLGAEFADDGIEGFWICAKHLLDHFRGVANNSSTGTGGGNSFRFHRRTEDLVPFIFSL